LSCQVRRVFANGRVKQTKTRLSRPAVPLQAIALEALDQVPQRDDSPLLFANARTCPQNPSPRKPLPGAVGLRAARCRSARGGR
jgi:hypothetical protein